MMSTRTSWVRALAISTICCWPMRRFADDARPGRCPARGAPAARGPCRRSAAPVDGHAAHELLGQEEVVEHRQVGAEVELLEDDADAVPCAAAARWSSSTGWPSMSTRPVGRLLDARQDLHQRRLAGAVLADEHVDLCRACTSNVTSSSAVVPGEDLGDVLGAHGTASAEASGGAVRRDRRISSSVMDPIATGTRMISADVHGGLVEGPQGEGAGEGDGLAHERLGIDASSSATTRLLISEATLPYSVCSRKSPNSMKPVPSRIDDSSLGMRLPM